MSDIERELRERLTERDLPPAPPSLHVTLRAAVMTPVEPRRSRRGPIALLAVAALLVVGAVVLATGGQRQQAVVPEASETLLPSAEPLVTVTLVPATSFPAEVEGLRVYRVSELLTERAAGRVSGGPIALAGYWSDASMGHSCAPPDSDPGILEIYCHDGEYGITERYEQVAVLTRERRVIKASGPMLTPIVQHDMEELFSLPPVNGQPYPPVPILVIGHLDDERAADCREEARQLCADRFVLDRIVDFRPAAVPTPGITPPPTPFPFESPPEPAFDTAMCQPEGMSEPPEFSFIGWMDGTDLKLTSQRVFEDETLYVAITKDAVPLGSWFEMSGDDRESLPMGRLVCLAHEWDPGAMEFDSVLGTFARIYRDGSTRRPTP